MLLIDLAYLNLWNILYINNGSTVNTTADILLTSKSDNKSSNDICDRTEKTRWFYYIFGHNLSPSNFI